MKTNALAPELSHKIHAYWRAANYLSVGQIYLYDNPRLQKPLTLAHVKPSLLGQWGTTPGLNFIYVQSGTASSRSTTSTPFISPARAMAPRAGGERLLGGHL